jgi:hypothetical protein
MVGVLLGISCGSGSEVDAGPARATEFRSSRVESVLEEASRIVRTRGFAPEASEWRGFVVEQGTEVRSFGMRTGNCYVVLAAGSAALREIDLRIFDGDGAEVARDGEQGSLAVIRHCPAQNGTYYLAVRAAVGSGLFAVREFRGPTGLPFRVDDVLRAVTPSGPERARE